MILLPLLGLVRERLSAEVFSRVAGPDGPSKRDQIAGSPGPRYFADDRPIKVIHNDASMFAGGMRAILLQALHPLAMAGVAAHSGFRGDPWGRLQRTSYFLAVTTFGSTVDAERMIARIRAVHETVRGIAADGRPYAASDPHLLKWVHVTEVDSFLAAYNKYGQDRLSSAEQDAYVQDMAKVGAALGVLDPPFTVRELRDQLSAYLPELRSTADARSTARFILFTPPLPLVLRPAYGVLAATAVSLLPWWARMPLQLPYLPVTEAVGVRAAGEVVTRTLRWALTEPAATAPAATASGATAPAPASI